MVQSMLMQRLVAHGMVWLVALLLVVGYVRHADAANILINITAEVESVDDSSNILNGAIQAGDTITGSYLYESTTPDSNPLPTVGDYQHSMSPFGIIVYAGGFQFSTDPSNVDFLVEIVNDHDTGAGLVDNYLLRSYNNIFQPPRADGAIVSHIAWQLDDPTARALSSTALSTQPPVLARWQSIFGLTIEGQSLEGFNQFFIRAHVTSARRMRP